MLLSVFLCAGTVYAAGSTVDREDPEYRKELSRRSNYTQVSGASMEGLASAKASAGKNPFTGLVYDHGTKLQDNSVQYGIDVSKWQPYIDWKKVKESGVSFVFLRIGYSTISQGTMCADPLFDGGNEAGTSHYAGAKSQGLKIGIYYFSQAATIAEAKAEANYTLKLLGNRKLDLPIVYDYESDPGYRNYGLSREEGTAICKAYCNVIRKAGYKTIVYANKSYLSDEVDAASLALNNQIWLARYNTFTAYTGEYTYWQYTESGTVPGIVNYKGDSVPVDCNFRYVKKSTTEDPQEETPTVNVETPTSVKIEALTKSSLSLNWIGNSSNAGYEIYRSTAYTGDYQKIGDVDFSTFTDTGVTQGREYYYKIYAYKDVDGKRSYSEASLIAAGHTAFDISYQIVTTAALNLRSQAGVEFSQIGDIPQGTVLSLVAITSRSNGDTWYRVSGTVNGSSVKGYVSGLYSKPLVGSVIGLKGTPKKTTSVKLNWTAMSGVTGYHIYRADSRKGKYVKIATVTGTSYTNTGLVKYAQYYYKVRAYTKLNGVTTYGSFSQISLLGGKGTSINVQTTARTLMNYYNGSAFKRLCYVPAGTVLNASHRTKDGNGVWWYLCKGTVNGKTVTGYVSTVYLRKVS